MTMNENVEIIIRTIFAYIWLWLYTKLIGRRLIAHNSYHLYVLSTVLGTVVGNMAFNVKIELTGFLLSLLILSGIGYGLMRASLRSKRACTAISGEPVVVIENGVILEERILASKYSREALLQGLRSKDIFHPEVVERAILEIDGSLSVLKKKEYRNMTISDLKALFPDRFPQ